jgi:hypothetical protein
MIVEAQSERVREETWQGGEGITVRSFHFLG